MLAALLLLPAGVCYMKMTGDTANGWRGRGGESRQAGEAREREQKWKVRKRELKVRDGERRVGLSVSLCLLQPVPPLQHLM